MPTKYISMTGTTKYVNGSYGGLFEPDQKYGNFQIRLYPDPKSWEVYKRSGLRLEPKTDDDGDYLTFRRPEQKLLNKELVNFGRPKVFFKEGIEPTKNIGNGSTVEVNVAVYDTREGKGHRLEAVSVLELIEYERGSGGRVGNFIELKDERDADPSNKVDSSDPRGSRFAETDSSTTNSGKGAEVRSPKKTEEVAPWDEPSDSIPFGEEAKEEPVKKASPFKKMSR